MVVTRKLGLQTTRTVRTQYNPAPSQQAASSGGNDKGNMASEEVPIARSPATHPQISKKGSSSSSDIKITT